VRAAKPGLATSIYRALGDAYHCLEDFTNSIEHHTQILAIAKEMQDRLGEGTAYGCLGIVYDSLGDFEKVSHAVPYQRRRETWCWSIWRTRDSEIILVI
jgi:hypothetical protein